MSINPGVIEAFDSAIETSTDHEAKALVIALKAHAQATSDAAAATQNSVDKLTAAVTAAATRLASAMADAARK